MGCRQIAHFIVFMSWLFILNSEVRLIQIFCVSVQHLNLHWDIAIVCMEIDGHETERGNKLYVRVDENGLSHTPLTLLFNSVSFELPFLNPNPPRFWKISEPTTSERVFLCWRDNIRVYYIRSHKSDKQKNYLSHLDKDQRQMDRARCDKQPLYDGILRLNHKSDRYVPHYIPCSNINNLITVSSKERLTSRVHPFLKVVVINFRGCLFIPSSIQPHGIV